MKRNMDLVRLQLLRVEGETEVPELAEFTEEQCIYHMALLIEAGFVEGVIRKGPNGYPSGTVAIRLTWQGHEFLDSARSSAVWNKAQETLKKSGVEVSVSILKDLLTSILKGALGLPAS